MYVNNIYFVYVEYLCTRLMMILSMASPRHFYYNNLATHCLSHKIYFDLHFTTRVDQCHANLSPSMNIILELCLATNN